MISKTLVAIKLSNCYVVHDNAINCASFINELPNLKLFEVRKLPLYSGVRS